MADAVDPLEQAAQAFIAAQFAAAAVEIDFHLAFAELHRPLDVGVGHALDVAHDEQRTEWLIERLDRCEQRLAQPLAVHGLARRLVPGLIPRWMPRATRLAVRVDPVIDPGVGQPLPADMVDHGVAGDPHQPGEHLVRVDGAPVPPQLDEHFLGDVVGVLPAAQAVAGEGVDPLPVAFNRAIVISFHVPAGCHCRTPWAYSAARLGVRRKSATKVTFEQTRLQASSRG